MVIIHRNLTQHLNYFKLRTWSADFGNTNPLLQCKLSDLKVHSVFFIEKHWNISITDMKFKENYWPFNTKDDLNYSWSRGCYGYCLHKVKTIQTTAPPKNREQTNNKLYQTNFLAQW